MEKHNSPEGCPNCGTLNQSGAFLCVSCGVDIKNYREHYPKVIDLDGEKIDELPKSRKSSGLRRRFAGIVTLLSLVVVLSGLLIVFLVKNNHKNKQSARYFFDEGLVAFTQADYKQAKENLSKAKEAGYELKITIPFLCLSLENLSKEAFSENRLQDSLNYARECLILDPKKQSCSDRLCQAGYALAVWQVVNHDYEGSIKLIDDMKSECPEQDDFDELLYGLYEQWYERAKSNGQLIKARRIYEEWKTRFPDLFED